jgi:hypothetical protein
MTTLECKWTACIGFHVWIKIQAKPNSSTCCKILLDYYNAHHIHMAGCSIPCSGVMVMHFSTSPCIYKSINQSVWSRAHLLQRRALELQEQYCSVLWKPKPKLYHDLLPKSQDGGQAMSLPSAISNHQFMTMAMTCLSQ